MKKKSKRYYGMTVTQLGILGGAAAFGLLILGVIFIVVLTSTTQAQPAATAIVSTSTPTLAPTARVLADTPTPTPAPIIATSVPPGGWVEFTTQNATLWLPGNFVGGDLVHKKAETIIAISRLGRSHRNVVNGLKDVSDEYVLWMVDKIVKQSDIISTVTVRHIISTEDMSLDQYIKEFLNSDQNGTPVAMLMTVNETKKATILGREAKRLTYNVSFIGHGITNLVYYIKDGANIWIIEYSVSPNNYLDMLPEIEQSIHTFNIIP